MRIPCTYLWNGFHSVFPRGRVGRTLVSERILCFFKKKTMKVKAVGSSSKGQFLILVLPPKTPTTKSRHFFKPQFPHVYEGGEMTVLAKMVLEVNRIFHAKYSA